MRSDFEPVAQEVDHVASAIVDAALQLHRSLGPGLLRMRLRGLSLPRTVRTRPEISTADVLAGCLRWVRLEAGLRVDLLVAERVIVEIKAVEQIIPLFEAQVLTYLKLTGKRVGLLINFNVPKLKDGIKRLIL